MSVPPTNVVDFEGNAARLLQSLMARNNMPVRFILIENQFILQDAPSSSTNRTARTAESMTVIPYIVGGEVVIVTWKKVWFA